VLLFKGSLHTRLTPLLHILNFTRLRYRSGRVSFSGPKCVPTAASNHGSAPRPIGLLFFSETLRLTPAVDSRVTTSSSFRLYHRSTNIHIILQRLWALYNLHPRFCTGLRCMRHRGFPSCVASLERTAGVDQNVIVVSDVST